MLRNMRRLPRLKLFRRSIKYTYSQAYHEGLREGMKNQPAVTQAGYANTFINSLLSAAATIAGDYTKRWTAERDWIQDLVRDYCDAYRVRQHDLDRELKDNERRYFEGWPCLSPGWAYVLLAFIGIGEIPLNAIVFRAMGAIDLYCYMIATILGILIPLACHLMGGKLKEFERSLKDWLIIGAISCALVIYPCVVGIIRYEYLREENINMGGVTFAYIVISMLLSLGGIIIAYAAHRPAHRSVMRQARMRWVAAAVALDKKHETYRWVIQQQRNLLDCLKDVYIGANLLGRKKSSGGATDVPAIFYAVDFDDEEIFPLDEKLNS